MALAFFFLFLLVLLRRAPVLIPIGHTLCGEVGIEAAYPGLKEYLVCTGYVLVTLPLIFYEKFVVKWLSRPVVFILVI